MNRKRGLTRNDAEELIAMRSSERKARDAEEARHPVDEPGYQLTVPSHDVEAREYAAAEHADKYPDSVGAAVPDSTPGNIRHPEITVQLTGTDGNAYAVLGAVDKAMRRAGVPQSERDQFRSEATAGDYNHLLATCMRWVDVS